MENGNKEISFDNEENNENENKINNKDNDNLVIDKKNDATEKDENRINFIKNGDHNLAPESKDNLKEEISEEELTKLSDIIFNQKIFNEKKNKDKFIKRL